MDLSRGRPGNLGLYHPESTTVDSGISYYWLIVKISQEINISFKYYIDIYI